MNMGDGVSLTSPSAFVGQTHCTHRSYQVMYSCSLPSFSYQGHHINLVPSYVRIVLVVYIRT